MCPGRNLLYNSCVANCGVMPGQPCFVCCVAFMFFIDALDCSA